MLKVFDQRLKNLKKKAYRSIRNRWTENSWLLVPYSTKANHFCELRRQKIQTYEPCSSTKRFAFVEYGTRSQEFSVSDRSVVHNS